MCESIVMPAIEKAFRICRKKSATFLPSKAGMEDIFRGVDIVVICFSDVGEGGKACSG